jgi:tetratricopeptide (TPR) repeat protein
MDSFVLIFVFLFLWIGYTLLRQRQYRRGLKLYQAEDYAGALAAYDRAIRLHPRDWSAYYSRGLIYFHQQNLQAALADLDKAANLHPRDARIYVTRANVHKQHNDLDKAIADLDTAIRLDPESETSYLTLGGIYYLKGDADSAVTTYTTVINALEEQLEKSRKFGPYLRLTEDAVGTPARLAYAYLGRSQASGNPADYDKAIVLCGETIAANPEKSAWAYSVRAATYYHRGEQEKAIADYSEALHLGIDDPVIYSDRGEAYFAAGLYPEALADFQRCREAKPDLPNAKAGLALTHHALGETDKALMLWRELIAENTSYRDPDWLERALNWATPLTDEARKLIARLDAEI